jgi:hypothetical protein
MALTLATVLTAVPSAFLLAGGTRLAADSTGDPVSVARLAKCLCFAYPQHPKSVFLLLV